MPDPPLRRILHCDMDCFYAAVHTRDDPSLEGKPVVVGGDPSGRGVVAAANYEARKYGIHSAMPAAQARRQCPNTIFLRPEFKLYREESQQIFAIYGEYTPLIQPLSLDEAFLDISEHLAEFNSATEVAEDIRRRVREERRLTVSVGVAPNKLVAKIASDFRKPDGLTVVRPHEVEAFLAPLPVRRLYGIGPAAERSSARNGHHDCGGAPRTLDRPADGEVRKLGAGAVGTGAWDRRSTGPYPPRTQEPEHRAHLCRKRQGPRRDRQDPRYHGRQRSPEGLEKRRLAASTITVKVRYPDFTTPTRSHSLPVPTSDAATIGAAARELVRRTDAARQSVRLLGVGASNLVPGELGQMALFEE